MTTSPISLTTLLERAKQQLSQPFAYKQRRLLIYLNWVYMVLAPSFLYFEWRSTGHFVPHIALGYVFVAVFVTNFFSAFYNTLLLRGTKGIRIGKQTYELTAESNLDIAARWISILSIMLLAALNMIGFGNPSNDAVLVDFAFGHSLIVLAAILLGRRVAFVWFLIVLGILLYTTFRIGYNYRYNYLTEQESTRYEQAINQKKPWAIDRQRTLREQGLNPPTVSRYVHEWTVFILIAFFTAYFFTGISLDMIKIIPVVTQDIANAIDEINKQELERERERNVLDEQKMLLKQESLQSELNFLKSQLNPHFLYNTLHYLYIKSLECSEELADSILKVSDIMRYSLREGSDYVFIKEEITYMNDYIALHQLRNKNNLNIDFTVTGDVEGKRIIPFILISLVENAFKHGKTNEKQSPVVIRLTCTDNGISFYMHNQKNQKPTVDSTHVGLANIQRRLDLTYPSSHTFKVEQDVNSFSCWLSIQA